MSLAEAVPASAFNTTIGGKPCAQLVRGTGEGLAIGAGPQLTKSYLCAWPDRYAVANALLGVATVAGVGTITMFNDPMPHPESPNALATDVNIIGRGRPRTGPDGQLAFEAAEVMVRYAAPQYGISPGPIEAMHGFDPQTTFVYAKQTIHHAEEGIEVPGNLLAYRAGPDGPLRPFNKSMVVPHAYAILQITFFSMRYLPVATLQYYNYLNDRPFLGTPKGHTRFRGSTTDRDWVAGGEPSQTVTNVYEYRPHNPWNYAPNALDPNSTQWIEVCYSNGQPISKMTDLAADTLPMGYYFGAG